MRIAPCNYTLTFEASVNDGKDLPDFISLNQIGKLEFLTATREHVGKYEILLTAFTGNELPLQAHHTLTIVVIEKLEPVFLDPLDPGILL